MSQATAFAQEAVSVEVSTGNISRPEVDTNSLEVRWGFQLSQRHKLMSSHECGISYVPFGKLFPIKTFFAPREYHTIDWTQPKENIVTISAAEAENYLMESLGGRGAQTRVNWGLMTGFLGDADSGKMALFNAILMPSLSRMREIGKTLGIPAIENSCPGEDDLDYGERESCVSCALAWLQSKTLETYIDQCSQAQFQINEIDRQTGETVVRTYTPAARELRSAKALMLESARTGHASLRAQWNEIATEYEKADGVRKDISEIEHGYRKDLHQSRPQDRQINLAKAMAQGANQANNSNDELIRMLAQGQVQLQQSLGQIAAKLGGPNVETAAPIITEPVTATVLDIPEGVDVNAPAETSTELSFADRMKQAKANKSKEK